MQNAGGAHVSEQTSATAFETPGRASLPTRFLPRISHHRYRNSARRSVLYLLHTPESDGAKYRALITDVNLASRERITGWEVARRARELNDRLPVIYMTGGNGHEWASQGVPNSILVSKPFAVAQIVVAVSQLLNESDL
jgi:CheY-like chemotaxis protein